MALAFAMAGLQRGALWPSSDLEGHVDAVELFRQGLTHGLIWPFDRRSAGGCDAAAFYAWPCELGLAGIAQLLVLLGVAHAARWVVMAALVGGVCALPLSAAWCARRLALAPGAAGGGAADPSAAAQAGCQAAHAGALGAWVFLATHTSDGMSGYGMDAVGLGLLEQILGWNLLLLVAARAAVPARVAWDAWLSLLIAGVIGVHALSALAVAVVLGLTLRAAPRRLLRAAALGVGGGAMSLAALAHVHGELLQERPWMALRGEDPLCAWLDRLLVAGHGWLVVMTSAWLGGLLALLGAWWTVRSHAPGRPVVHAAVALTAVACLPCIQLCLPAAAQLYRLQAPAWLLLVVVGSAQAPQLLRLLRPRAAPWALRAIVAVLWLGLGLDQLAAWHLDPPDAQAAALQGELTVHVPAGSRVLAADQTGWHRWIVEEWKEDQDWESLGCLQTTVAPPLSWAVEPAAARLGLRLCGVAPPPSPPLSAAEAEAILRDCGVSHALRRQLRDAAPDPPDPDGPAPSWPHLHTPHWEVWSVPDPLPRLSPCTTGMAVLTVPGQATLRRLVALWAARTHADWPQAPRLILVTTRAGDLRSGQPLGIVSSCPQLAVDWSSLPLGAAPGLLRDEPGIAPLAAAVWQALAPLGAQLHGLEQRSPHPAAPAVRPPGAGAQLRWLDPDTLQISGLQAQQPYLLRYAWSPDMACLDGALWAEGCGMTILIPRTAQLRITINSCSVGVRIGCGISLVVLGLCLLGGFRQRRGSGDGRAVAGMPSAPRRMGGWEAEAAPVALTMTGSGRQRADAALQSLRCSDPGGGRR